jgi:hypothetical protein
MKTALGFRGMMSRAAARPTWGQGASQGNAVGRCALYSEAHTSDGTGVPPGYNGKHSRGRGTRARQFSIDFSAPLHDAPGRPRIWSQRCTSATCTVGPGLQGFQHLNPGEIGLVGEHLAHRLNRVLRCPNTRAACIRSSGS